ncbi:MAG TPA: glycosyltransferase family 9 protein [Terriglobales bacterium]|nr:glycosyltransferase family 9 protein [Terriglobales bacterium]
MSAALTASDRSATERESPKIRRLLIVRLGSMGDILHTLPAAWLLRAALPQAFLGWLVEERWTELLCAASEPRSGPRSPRRPLVDNLHVVDTKSWRKNPLSVGTFEQVASALSELRGQHYDVAVDFQGAVRSALLARLAAAATIYGFRQPRETVATMFYMRQLVAQAGHVVEQNLALAKAVLGGSAALANIEFPCDVGAERQCQAWLESHSIRDFVLLNPGAGWGAKQWPPERYGRLAQCLAEMGLTPVVNVGPGEEKLARAVEEAGGGAARTVAGSLSELIALTRRAKLFVGGDTGPMHLAAALAIPVVAIFGPTRPDRNGPYTAASIVLRSPSSETSYARRRLPEAGLLEIGVEDVRAACEKLLGQCRG